MLIIIVFVVLLVLVISVITFMVATYNKLVKKKNKVRNSWANIDAQLQRRFDLIPNLVEIVNGYATHEFQVIESIAAARNGFLGAHNASEKIAMNEQLTANLKSLYVVVENYPDLKTNVNYLKLQDVLAEIEEDLSYARQFYNDAVTIYNNSIQSFPSNMIAAMFNFQEETFFKAVKGAEIAPKIKIETRRYSKYSQCPVCGADVDREDNNCRYCGCSLIN